MPLPDFREQIDGMVRRFQQYSKWSKDEDRRLRKLQKQDEKLKNANFHTARIEALRKLALFNNFFKLTGF